MLCALREARARSARTRSVRAGEPPPTPLRSGVRAPPKSRTIFQRYLTHCSILRRRVSRLRCVQ